tara:strand:+ start:163 stop:276 length:114 start_codon:yes stop_codon:yes gene_type:complete
MEASLDTIWVIDSIITIILKVIGIIAISIWIIFTKEA